MIIKSSASSVTESEVDLFKPKNTSQYKLELLDHPKAGNLSVQNSLSRVSFSRSLSPRHSVTSPFGSQIVFSPTKQSPKGSNNTLKSMASISKLSRSIQGSRSDMQLPVDKTHEKTMREYLAQKGSFSIDDFIIIHKSSAQYTAVLEDYELNDHDGTLVFQLLSIKNNYATLKREELSDLVKKARSVSYIFVSSLFCVLPSSDSIIFVLDYHLSNLQKILNQNNRRLPENAAKFFMAEILLGLEYLHDHGIVYKDLNPENILITETGHVKLVNPIVWNGLNGVHGTPGYIAPEVIHLKLESKLSDYWSFGCILYELLTSDTPYPRDVKDPIYAQMILEGKINPPKFHNSLSKNAIDLISKCLCPNLSERIGSWKGSNDLKCHQWFTSIPRWKAVEEYLLIVPFIPDIYYYQDQKSDPDNDDEAVEYPIKLNSASQLSNMKQSLMNDLISDINSKQEKIISKKLGKNKSKNEFLKKKNDRQIKIKQDKKSLVRSQIDIIKNSLKKKKVTVPLPLVTSDKKVRFNL